MTAAPAWMTDVAPGPALIAVLLPGLAIAYGVGNVVVEGPRRRAGLALIGTGLFAAAACLAAALACDGDQRGLCAYSRSWSEMLSP